MYSMRGVWVFGCALFVALALPTAAAATWSEPINLSGVGIGENRAGEITSPARVAVDADGNTTFVWTQLDGTRDDPFGGPCCARVVTRTRWADGRLSPLRTLNADGETALEVEVAVSPTGDRVFMWSVFTSEFGETPVRVRALSAGGELSPIQTVTPPGSFSGSPRVVAVDSGGGAVLSWNGDKGLGPFRLQIRKRLASGALGPIQNLSDNRASVSGSDVAVNRAGDAVFVWRQEDYVRTRTRTADASLSPIQTLAREPGSFLAAEVDANEAGDAAFTWTRYRNGERFDARARTRSSAGVLGPVQTVSDLEPGRNCASGHVGIDDAGHEVFSWRCADANSFANPRGYFRVRSFDGAFGPPRALRVADLLTEPDGDTLLISPDGESDVIQARWLSPGGTLGPPRTLASSDVRLFDPESTPGPRGNIVVSWLRLHSYLPRVQAVFGP